jgi:hypothetical protein
MDSNVVRRSALSKWGGQAWSYNNPLGRARSKEDAGHMRAVNFEIDKGKETSNTKMVMTNLSIRPPIISSNLDTLTDWALHHS